eukprot:CAMPEP_0182451264 /NCGR_PEP_ID=MMETSP1172-20130603/43621_1 /TAXON_ID=708627 /ORGANISM="Timspurckia oligopyrenoides, Strain CCMP3278" /LENGTH=228 /DNA_ID=CAMNT_0024649021 /DNA_START=3481 /DNA_END=4167 /DNA_ORIENTATION=+
MQSSTNSNSNASHVLYAKAGPDGTSLGDCPFTQKVLMALLYSKIPFKLQTINTMDKPDWFITEINPNGTVPVLITPTQTIADSEQALDYIESLDGISQTIVSRDASVKDIVGGVFGAFVGMLKCGSEEVDAKKKELDQVMFEFEEYLERREWKENEYLCGDTMTRMDFNLIPKLYHVKVAGWKYREYAIPEQCSKVLKYLQNGMNQECFELSKCDEDTVIWGWSKFFK